MIRDVRKSRSRSDRVPHARTQPAAIPLYALDLAPLVQGDDGGLAVAETIVSERTFHLTKISLIDARNAIASGRAVSLIDRQQDRLWAAAATEALAPPRLALQDRSGATPAVPARVW